MLAADQGIQYPHSEVSLYCTVLYCTLLYPHSEVQSLLKVDKEAPLITIPLRLAPQLFWFGIDGVKRIMNERITYSMNDLMTKVFIEQPRLHRVC